MLGYSRDGCLCDVCLMSVSGVSSQDVGLALRTLLATVDETIPVLPASTHREVRHSLCLDSNIYIKFVVALHTTLLYIFIYYSCGNVIIIK